MLGFGLKIGKLIKKPAPPELVWILVVNSWDDSGVWVDSETWND